MKKVSKMVTGWPNWNERVQYPSANGLAGIKNLVIGLLFLGVSFFGNSCSTPEEESGEVYSLSFKTFEFDQFNTPVRLKHLKEQGVLVLTDIDNYPSVHLLNIDQDGNIGYHSGFGGEGRGPDEYASPQDILLTSREGILFYIYDAGNRKLVPYDDQFEAISQEVITIQTDGMPTHIFEVDTQFIFAGIVVDGHLEKLSESGESIWKTGEVDQLGSNFTVRHHAMAWRNSLTVNPGNGRIAVFFREAAMALMFDEEGNLLQEYKYISNIQPSPQFELQQSSQQPFISPLPEAMTTYTDVASDEKYIYALFSGKDSAEQQPSYGSEIHKFDWNLNRLAVYEIDHQAFSIETDGSGGIYTIQHDPEVALRFAEGIIE